MLVHFWWYLRSTEVSRSLPLGGLCSLAIDVFMPSSPKHLIWYQPKEIGILSPQRAPRNAFLSRCPSSLTCTCTRMLGPYSESSSSQPGPKLAFLLACSKCSATWKCSQKFLCRQLCLFILHNAASMFAKAFLSLWISIGPEPGGWEPRVPKPGHWRWLAFQDTAKETCLQ